MGNSITEEMKPDTSYPDELFQKESLPKIDSDLRCIICYNIMFDSVRCPQDCCFCRSCADEAIKVKPTCPGCRVPLKKVNLMVNRKLNNMIAELVVVCKQSKQYEDASRQLDIACASSSSSSSSVATISTRKRKVDEENNQKEEGSDDNEEPLCQWTGPLKDLSNHVAVCEFVIVKCKFCLLQMRKRLVAEHVEKHHKSVTCLLCNASFQEDDRKSHDDTYCSKLIISCRNCDQKYTKDEKTKHEEICELKTVCCPYQRITGCNFECYRKDMPSHTMDSGIHMTGLFNHLLELEKTCEHLYEEKCNSIISDIAREISYPVYSELAKKTDNTNFSKESVLTKLLLSLTEMVLPPSNEHMPILVLEKSRTTLLKDQDYYRETLSFNLETPKVLGAILGKPGHFNSDQIKYALLAIYGIFFNYCSWTGEGITADIITQVFIRICK